MPAVCTGLCSRFSISNRTRACSKSSMDTITSFGSWLKQRRKALDLTQEELARRIGCATVTLQKIELDERRPSKEIAARMAEALEIPVAVPIEPPAVKLE